MHSSIMNRLSSLVLESWDLGGAGDCFLHCFAPIVGMTVPELRHRVAQHMREGLAISSVMEDISAIVIWSVHVDFMP
jgi:hypothetical protein